MPARKRKASEVADDGDSPQPASSKRSRLSATPDTADSARSSRAGGGRGRGGSAGRGGRVPPQTRRLFADKPTNGEDGGGKSPEPLKARKSVPWQALRPRRLAERRFSIPADEVGDSDEDVAEIPHEWDALTYISRGTFGTVVGATAGGGARRAVKMINIDDNPMIESAIRELHHLVFFTRDAPHKNIIELCDAWFVHARLYVAMKMYPETLEGVLYHAQKKMRRGRGRRAPAPCLAAAARARIAVALLGAIQHLHYFGIVHRDLKPGNVVVDEALQDIRLIDLGSLRHPQVARECGPPLTPAKNCMTEGYYAPETLQDDGNKYSNEADNFAVGLVLAQCITGKVIFEGEHDVKLEVPKLNLEKTRRQFVRGVVGGYDGVMDAEVELVTSLLAAHPAARATATQALRKIRASEISAHLDEPLVMDEVYTATTPVHSGTPKGAPAKDGGMGAPGVRKVPPSAYREPVYHQEDGDLMLEELKGHVAQLRVWLKAQREAADERRGGGE